MVRSHHQAYAYLLTTLFTYPKRMTKGRGKKRFRCDLHHLKTLGAGFALATPRFLESRGAASYAETINPYKSIQLVLVFNMEMLERQ